MGKVGGQPCFKISGHIIMANKFNLNLSESELAIKNEIIASVILAIQSTRYRLTNEFLVSECGYTLPCERAQ